MLSATTWMSMEDTVLSKPDTERKILCSFMYQWKIFLKIQIHRTSKTVATNSWGR